MSMSTLAWLLAAYLLTGLCLVTLGPLRHNIRRSLAAVEFAHGVREHLNPGFLSRLMALPKPLIMRVSAVGIVVGAIAGWPIFMPGLYAARKELQEIRRTMVAPEGWEPPPRTFSMMSGAGELHCRDCDHREGITAFLHGFGEDPSSTSGYQCTACHQFRHISRNQSEAPDLACTCGGTLSRDHIIVCPQCRSERMSYIDDGIIT